MTPNDSQMDVLLRRFASGAPGESLGEHLDADEMNTFAEGMLPPAARARYVSHLASCDECRQHVAQIALAGGAVIRAESPVSERPQRRPFWEGVSALFAPRGLRYAAFAAVLLIVAGIAFIALRRPQPSSELVASRTESDQHPASAIQPPAGATNGAATDANTRPQQSNSPATTSIGSDKAEDRDAEKLAEASPAPLAMKEAPTAPALEAKKAAPESDLAKSQPSYAPPPPGEAGQPTTVGGVAAKQEPMKTSQVDTMAGRAAERERSQGIVANQSRDDRKMKDQSVVTQQRRATDEKTKGGPSRNMENQAARNANENRIENTPLSIPAPKPNDTEEQTRSAGGRKFRKQGKAWVDQKFKSSMTLKSVARGSDEFNSLDSGLRSIAQQLGGEVIVVWKGKAYVIK
jgi:hypothetical protein